VVDLCGGTEATAAVLLEILPPGARIISIDAAGAMQAAGQRALPDPRISWIVARAEDAAQHIHKPADAVVYNSAIWKTHTPAAFAAVKQALRPGGRFVFNIGGSFAGLRPARTEPRPGPSLNELITAVAAEQYGYKPSPGPATARAADRRPGPGTAQRCRLHGPGHRDRHARRPAGGETRVAVDSRVRPPAWPVHP
jgi:SAM-dependent methyltransferase